ncbi:MAG: MBL fold metallo-hydrolase [Lachnospiraceae bacterium]|nr:MBL fold metallo-hydrolase [Lachnospiraceae bacterium]
MAYYRIRILELGYDPKFPAGVAFDFWHMGDRQIYSSFSMVLLEGEGHCILFDCGFDMEAKFDIEKIAMEGDQNCHDPAEVLCSIGVEPEKVDSIVLSHCHWDHMSGLRYFPNATIYVQRAEVGNWKRVMADEHFPLTHKSVVDMEALKFLDACDAKGRVTYLSGDVDELFPGISVRAASGHSFAQSMLFIDNDGTHFALIGDVSMRPESFTGTRDFPCFLPNLKFAVGTVEDITESYEKILAWVGGKVSRIFMTHNGSLADVWPTYRSDLGLNVTTVSEAEAN